MQIIKQKVERLYETGTDLVVRAARNCYQSKGNPENNIKFIKGLLKKGHTTPFQFWRLNMRLFGSSLEAPWWNNFQQFYRLCTKRCSVITESHIDQIIEIASKFTDHSNWLVFEITTNIAIGRELRTHQKMSYCQESTRYVNYDKQGLSFIPSDFEDNNVINKEFLEVQLEQTEALYKSLLMSNKPEITRDILPLCTATKIIMGGFKEDWYQFLDRRYYEKTGKVHPQMKEVAGMIKEYIENGSDL